MESNWQCNPPMIPACLLLASLHDDSARRCRQSFPKCTMCHCPSIVPRIVPRRSSSLSYCSGSHLEDFLCTVDRTEVDWFGSTLFRHRNGVAPFSRDLLFIRSVLICLTTEIFWGFSSGGAISHCEKKEESCQSRNFFSVWRTSPSQQGHAWISAKRQLVH